jgi:CMP-N,N'-diacetyllegionaminic acid synthase
MIKKKILGIITARSGSKGLKNKNILNFKGKPLLAYPIIALKKSLAVDYIFLSTDSDLYAQKGKKYGAKVPYLRKKELSSDKATSVEVVLDIIKWFKKKQNNFDIIILLEPTSPLTNFMDVRKVLNYFIKKIKKGSLLGISKIEKFDSQSIFNLGKNKKILTRNKKFESRQKLLNEYYLDGSFYISDVLTFLNKKSFIHNNTYGFELEKYKNIEIDTGIDFKIANLILKNLSHFKNETK